MMFICFIWSVLILLLCTGSYCFDSSSAITGNLVVLFTGIFADTWHRFLLIGIYGSESNLAQIKFRAAIWLVCHMSSIIFYIWLEEGFNEYN